MNKDKTSCLRPINLFGFQLLNAIKWGEGQDKCRNILAAMLLNAFQSSLSFNVCTSTDITTFSETTDC